jgi:hypothetical protein
MVETVEPTKSHWHLFAADKLEGGPYAKVSWFYYILQIYPIIHCNGLKYPCSYASTKITLAEC